MSRRTKWLNIIGTILLIILGLIVIGAGVAAISGVLGDGGTDSSGATGGSESGDGDGSGEGGSEGGGGSGGSSGSGSESSGFSSFLAGLFGLSGCSSCSGGSSGDGSSGGDTVSFSDGADLSEWLSEILGLGGTGSLFLEEGDYVFTTEEGGLYIFTAGEGGSLTISDGEANEWLIEDGESVEIELGESETVNITANVDSEVTISTGSSDDSTDGSGGGSGDSGVKNLDTSGKIEGPSSGSNSGSGSGSVSTAFGIYSEASGTQYVKLISYGDYQGSSWAQAEAYANLLHGGYSMSYLSGLALENSGYSSSEVEIINYTTDYILPYLLSVYGGDYDVQTSDVYYTGSSSTYSMYAYYYDYLTEGSSGLSLPSSYSAAERAYRGYVYENYTSVNSSTLTYLNKVIKEQNFDQSDVYTLISQIVEYVQNAATYNASYDSALNDEDDIIVAFLSDYQEGVCQHFASAATLLLRACGIPARYTGGYLTTTTAGEWTYVTSLNAHAWVEVYIDGIGWVVVDPTPNSLSGDDGAGGTEKINITVYSKSGEKTYDGTAYSLETVSYSGTLSAGHKIVCKFNSYTDVGLYSNAFEVTIVDGDGNDVTDKYNITTECGTIEITKRNITITTGSDSKTYDGTALTCGTFTSSNLVSGHSVEIVFSGSQTLRGESENEVESIKIYDKDGNDVTKNYAIKIIYGTLSVT